MSGSWLNYDLPKDLITVLNEDFVFYGSIPSGQLKGNFLSQVYLITSYRSTDSLRIVLKPVLNWHLAEQFMLSNNEAVDLHGLNSMRWFLLLYSHSLLLPNHVITLKRYSYCNYRIFWTLKNSTVPRELICRIKN